MLPIDFGPSARVSIDWAIEFASAHRAQLDVLHVWEESQLLPRELRTAGRYLRLTLAEIARAHARRAMYELVGAALLYDRSNPRIGLRVETGRPHERILALAREYDLIVMRSHDGGTDEPARIGTVALRVMSAATCPVLTLPASTGRAAWCGQDARAAPSQLASQGQ